jgi:hypothetical protein
MFFFNSLIPKGDRLVIELFSTGCKGSKNEINYLEHVQAVISVQSNTRGTLVVTLRSPMGTNSTLLDRRMLDQSEEMFNKWPFTSVHMWGEKPQGTWILEIKNLAKNSECFAFRKVAGKSTARFAFLISSSAKIVFFSSINQIRRIIPSIHMN